MDPVTAGFQFATALITLLTKIYEDTPLPIRQRDAEKREKFFDAAGTFLTTGKLPSPNDLPKP